MSRRRSAPLCATPPLLLLGSTQLSGGALCQHQVPASVRVAHGPAALCSLCVPVPLPFRGQRSCDSVADIDSIRTSRPAGMRSSEGDDDSTQGLEQLAWSLPNPTSHQATGARTAVLTQLRELSTTELLLSLPARPRHRQLRCSRSPRQTPLQPIPALASPPLLLPPGPATVACLSVRKRRSVAVRQRGRAQIDRSCGRRIQRRPRANSRARSDAGRAARP